MTLYQPKVFKVLHQPHSIAKYHPIAIQDILWPCLRFAVSLEAKAYEELNLFESTLLRLISEGSSELDELSRQMGLSNEEERQSSLVEFLSLKLQQLGLITDRLRLTAEGKQVLDKINSNETKVVGATVYFDLINYRWLPIISRGELKSVSVELSESRLVEFYQGSVGKAKKIQALPILCEKSDKKAPTERDVIEIIKRSRQQSRKLNSYSSRSKDDGFITRGGTISVNPESELIYLHCYAFGVSGSDSFYVSDGFRSTIQDGFTRGFNSYKKRESNPSTRMAYDRLRDKRKRGHQLQIKQESKILSSFYKALTANKVKSAREQADYENNLTSFISQSYSELEQILAECYAFSKLKDCISESASDQQRNADLALKIAEKLGLDLGDGMLVNNLLKVNKGSVIHLKLEQPVMSPLLFCHLLAARKDTGQPIAKLAREYPEFLIDIATLRRWRNPIDHGDVASIRDQIGDEQVELIYQMVSRVRKILSDWLDDNNHQVSEQTLPDWYKDDIRRAAYDELEKKFGLMLNRMDKRIYNGLFDALVFAKLEDARPRTNALASALQHALRQACRSLDVNEAQSIEDTKSQLGKLGASQIIKSNDHKVQMALQCGNATLGANFIAFWAQITDQQQREFGLYEKFIKAVDDLDRIRGHSGAILEKHKHDQLNEIKKIVFEIIKRLMEQYCE